MSRLRLDEVKPSLLAVKKADEGRGVKREKLLADDAEELEDWNESRGRSAVADRGMATGMDLDEDEEVRSPMPAPREMTMLISQSTVKVTRCQA